MTRYAGRFFTDRYERHRIDRDIRLAQEQHGTVVLWYFYDPVNTVVNDTYDEGDASGGRRWKTPPLRVPVLGANRIEGARQQTDYGFYTVDRLDLRLSFQQALDVGLSPEMSLTTDVHLQDRVVYDRRVFELSEISVTGQFDPAGHDIVVRVAAVRVRPDELVNDPEFDAYTPWSSLTQVVPGLHQLPSPILTPTP